ncbi:hypothetical protein, partial [Methylophaga sp.]|uniref:hypothetical protein n=1 Tax=Methylophaga sp. TaxID=2024840 RepID=UPI0025CFDD44
ESNSHFRRNRILNPARLPVPPPRQQAEHYNEGCPIMKARFNVLMIFSCLEAILPNEKRNSSAMISPCNVPTFNLNSHPN